MTIEVTQEDIDSGIRKCCFLCPLANAMSRVTGLYAYVLSDSFSLWRKSRIVFGGMLPANARAFIRDFDAPRPVSPISFQIEYEPQHAQGE